MLKLALYLVGAYLAFVLLVYLMQNRLLYFPNMPGRELTATPGDIGLEFEDVEIVTEDGVRLHGWFVPGRAARRVVVFFHGNAGNISHRLDSIRQLHGFGLSVFIIDYRGFGRSGGKPSEVGTYRDALAAWHYLTAERGFEPREVLIFGRSVGGAIAAWLAARQVPAGLVVESTFTSVPDLAQELYPWLPARWLSRTRYATVDHVSAADCPVLVIHSREDEIVPFRHGEALFEAADEPKSLLALGGPHNGAHILDEDRYLAGVAEFVNRIYGLDEPTD